MPVQPGPEGVRYVTIEVPLGPDDPNTRSPEHFEVRLFEDAAGRGALAGVLAGLVQSGVRTPASKRHPHGRAVNSYADALRWLVQQLAVQAAGASDAAE